MIAICAHDANGALGIGVGQLVPRLGLHGLLAELKIEPGVAPDAPVHLGGPVETQRGFVLHSPDWGGDETLKVGARWALSGTLDILRAIAAGTGPSRWIVALGYAGWGEGQLDEEMTPARLVRHARATMRCCSIARPRSAGRPASAAPGSMRDCSHRARGTPEPRTSSS